MEVAPVLVLQTLYPADRGYAPVLGHPRAAVGTKRGRRILFSGLKQQGRKGKEQTALVSGPAAHVA